MRTNNIKYVWENRTLLIYIIAIIMILYSGYKQILLLGAGLEFLTLPISWYVTVINLIVCMLGIGIIRLKKYGWFGGSSLFLILFFINFLVVLSYFIYVIFNKSLVETFPTIKNIVPTKIVLNSKLLFAIIKAIVYGIIIRMFFESEVIEGYGLERFKKITLIGIAIITSVIAFFIYLGAYWLIIG